MRDLSRAISEQFLPRVNQPSQYIGLEINRRCARPQDAQVRCVLAFPDTYSLGISHLGSQVLYHAINNLDFAACDRTYCPPPEAETVLREQQIPLFAWESRLAVGDFEIVGFSLAYELCATNLLTLLDLAGVPIRSGDRDESHPIIVAGDALADSPEPFAPFVDVFLAGDGEIPLTRLAEVVRDAKRAGTNRADTLLTIAREVPGAYVPRFYEPHYEPDGTYAGLSRRDTSVPESFDRACLSDLSQSPAITAPLVPIAEAVHDRVALEVMRGCPNGCRFCQAGHTRLPVRTRSPEEIVDLAERALAATGYDEISLLSLSTSDYPDLEELLDRLTESLEGRHVNISLPSLRVDSQLQHLPRLTSGVRKAGLTIAAEAGSERLRRAIGKRITEQDMIAGVRAAYRAGWNKVKVYFIAGLPGETDDDLDAIVDLCRKLSDTRKEIDSRPGSINASVSWFVPKPHTPMQWSPMRSAEYFWHVRERLIERAKRSAVDLRFHFIEQSLLEGVIARGDRRMADVIEHAWRSGCRMDAWTEHFDYDRWLEAMQTVGIDPAGDAQRELTPGEPTPWSHIRCFRGAEFLRREFERMHAAIIGE